ncbi:MAG: Transcription elongation factor GreA [Chlamydiae bacterium]|nr:Transcription elongation factor GreA [Chlamydiota bacterium]
MAYLEEFKTRINHDDFPRFLQIWEEYANGESVDAAEFKEILNLIKESNFMAKFGHYVETALPLWSSIQDPDDSYDIIRSIMDLQTTNTPHLQELAMKLLKERYPNDPQFDLKTRLIGLRGVDNFQGALFNYDLLTHMDKGKFVFHTGGWGAGEIMDLSLVREQLVIEFELVLGKRDMSFKNAFKMLQPLSNDHFLSRRFGSPDKLEEEARQDPCKVIRLLLKDLGSKTAPEIKEELCEWVIPEEHWTKWWQNARAKLKKDTMVEVPSNMKAPFVLRETEVTHEDRLHKTILQSNKVNDIILATYNFVRDFPNMLRKEDVKKSIEEKIVELSGRSELSVDQELQILIFLENFLGTKIEGKELKDRVLTLSNIGKVLEDIQILAFKKRLLVAIRNHREDWVDIFLELLLTVYQNPLRDYLLKELSHPDTLTKLEHRIEELLHHPKSYPEAFVWYFQKISSDPDTLFSDKDGQCEFLESFLILLNQIETENKYRDLVKKMLSIITKKRYLVIRNIIEGSSLDFVKEFLLLVTKCQSFTNHDIKIMRSLAEVVYPSLAEGREERRDENDNVIWTSQEGFLKTQKHIEHVGTVEIVQNAKEIEEARALGDLRENSEYKFALEKRSRLQSELKLLSDQINRARIITEQDISMNEIGIGAIVNLINSQGDKITYTILGPWDADPDQHILSFQSKLAQAMMGFKEGETFTFRHDTYTVAGIRSFMK